MIEGAEVVRDPVPFHELPPQERLTRIIDEAEGPITLGGIMERPGIAGYLSRGQVLCELDAMTAAGRIIRDDLAGQRSMYRPTQPVAPTPTPAARSFSKPPEPRAAADPRGTLDDRVLAYMKAQHPSSVRRKDIQEAINHHNQESVNTTLCNLIRKNKIWKKPNGLYNYIPEDAPPPVMAPPCPAADDVPSAVKLPPPPVTLRKPPTLRENYQAVIDDLVKMHDEAARHMGAASELIAFLRKMMADMP